MGRFRDGGLIFPPVRFFGDIDLGKFTIHTSGTSRIFKKNFHSGCLSTQFRGSGRLSRKVIFQNIDPGNIDPGLPRGQCFEFLTKVLSSRNPVDRHPKWKFFWKNPRRAAIRGDNFAEVNVIKKPYHRKNEPTIPESPHLCPNFLGSALPETSGSADPDIIIFFLEKKSDISTTRGVG